MPEKTEILIVAGEASGDAHAARLVNALQELRPAGEFSFTGAAGPKMREAGVEAIVKSDGLAIVGLLEIARALPMFLRVYNDLLRAVDERKIRTAILVDFPDFNLKLAKALKKRGVRVVYYISPQLWAWRQYRLRTIRDHVDLVLSILPFEKDWYEKRGVAHVEYVGNPLTRDVHADTPKEGFCSRHNLDPNRPIISLLPGSRRDEIRRILPVLLSTSALLSKTRPDLQFVVAMPPGKAQLAGELRPANSEHFWIEGETLDALNASDAAAITSGTATLEAGIIGTPMAIVYKSSAVNYKLLRPLIDVEHFGLINLIAGKRLARELIQDDFTPATLAAEILRLLDPQTNAEFRRELSDAVETLGRGGASKRAAAAILKLIEV